MCTMQRELRAIDDESKEGGRQQLVKHKLVRKKKKQAETGTEC